MRVFLLLLAGSLISVGAFSQRVTNVRASMDGVNVRIVYDLESGSSSDLFEISLLSDHNNFTDPLKLVSGAVGKGIKPGKDQVISWRAQEELVNFRGQVVFEVRAAILGGYYTITLPTSSDKIKKGKLMTINWTGGNVGERVKIELIQTTGTAATISESVGNQGNYTWTVPKNLKPSKNYKVRITNTSDALSQGLSKAFSIKGKSAAVFILIPVLAAGGGAAVLMSQDDGGGNNPPDGENLALPLPPNP
ncbi:MAG TPA: GPI anchored serine-threonine rich family protein [Cyclobacteriaceae bacterium]|nr:GPI anchored serine-threonine rich family protein [Cyclobacteriaceae bacterium]